MSLSGKIALVTGSSRGIGAAIALELARRGSTVVINYRRDAAGAAAVCASVQAGGGRCSQLQADVSAGAEAAALVKAALERHGQIDILVNNAGVTRDALLLTMKDADWDSVLHTNLSSAYHVTRAALRSMLRRKAGRIVNIASVIGLTGQAGQANYAASKAGLIGLTKSLAREVGSRGITVNAVAPGYVDTDMVRAVPEAVLDKIVASIPVGRLGRADDVARAVLFLVADEADFVTGSTLSVNGGHHMY